MPAAGTRPDAVLAALADLDTIPASGDAEDDWRQASISRLCAHIATVHHHGLRQSLPRIERLLTTVVRVHGADHPELRQLQETFAALRAELEPRLDSEDRDLHQHVRQENTILLPSVRELGRHVTAACDRSGTAARNGRTDHSHLQPQPLPRAAAGGPQSKPTSGRPAPAKPQRASA
jgi:iron-sulfur cluster repair protein YtfE (RIC family)